MQQGCFKMTVTNKKTMMHESLDEMSSGAGQDLVSGILKIQVRNEDMITAQDKAYCLRQQESLYRTLDQIDYWYSIFKEEAEKYRDELKFDYLDSGKPTGQCNRYVRSDDKMSYIEHEFLPFDSMDVLVDKNRHAVSQFAYRIIDYFNSTYNLSVPVPNIDGHTLKMGDRPVYSTYVDMVISHLGGRTFRDTAEEELVKRFRSMIRPSRWSRARPELKKDRIVFQNITGWSDITLEFHGIYRLAYGYESNLSVLCKGIAFGSDDFLNGNTDIISRFDRDDVRLSEWYDLTTDNAMQMRFYKNGRVDVKFKDASAAESCYRRLGLDELEEEE